MRITANEVKNEINKRKKRSEHTVPEFREQVVVWVSVGVCIVLLFEVVGKRRFYNSRCLILRYNSVRNYAKM